MYGQYEADTRQSNSAYLLKSIAPQNIEGLLFLEKLLLRNEGDSEIGLKATVDYGSVNCGVYEDYVRDCRITCLKRVLPTLLIRFFEIK